VGWADHLIILPILLPLAAGAGLALISERRRALKLGLSLAATAALFFVAVLLFAATTSGTATATYRLGDWPVPFGIVLVGDRLAALMVLVAAVLGLAALVFASARWYRAGQHFLTMFQLLLMGLNGAFLTGDLFNLFVFFEVLLAASYGLLLHGSGPTRVRAALHYVAINLAASFLFLIGVTLIYGVTGTLNMADLARRIPAVAEADRGLLEAGAAILGMAFLVKAAFWPLNFWLPTTYAAASAPVAAVFAIMTKVGAYVLLRLSPLLFGPQAGPSAGFGLSWLLWGGMATLLFGTVGVLAAQSTARLAGYAVIVSSGTLIAAAGLGDAGVTSGALFYLAVSTLALGAFFLLNELVERSRMAGADVLSVTREVFGDDEDEQEDGESEEVGAKIPATTAVLGISFGMVGLLLAGLPPLAGFAAKFSIMASVLGLDGAAVVSAGRWFLIGLLVVSGLAVLVAMIRTGINIFWVTIENARATIRLVEIVPVIALLAVCAGMTVAAGPVQRFMEAAAAAIHAPGAMMEDILAGPQVAVEPALVAEGQP